ncbi:hypothetical protein Suden_0235 [Sulfurimonas denitrificans DSM 1251]|uniref:Uncharacterized protein n=1 Tax=Sulfurimonas denitrificans (strain ATCC 33889 / DSM 1251) TaxID=326298 RepID=Q30U15_SULDN|nr:hypothetical protein [Sulfurimonas denitrificans]ABB43516.1 hypothetical protein Suden_0235 [Sulfurimonas denitrificans DSM 1251]
MALSEEDKLWIEKIRKDTEREERELKRRGIIPYTEDELEEINAKKAEMREQARFAAEALKKVRVSKIGFESSHYVDLTDGIDINLAMDLTSTTYINPATGFPMISGIGGLDSGGNTYGF